MHQLLLLRHAKSSWDDAKLADRDRPLSKRGRRAATAMRKAMIDLGLTPDLVLVSPSRRTQETLAALEPWDDTPLVEQVETLYLASAQQLLAVLRDVNETVRSVMLIGHNPGMQELAVLLAGGSRRSAPCRFSHRGTGRVCCRNAVAATRRCRHQAGPFPDATRPPGDGDLNAWNWSSASIRMMRRG